MENGQTPILNLDGLSEEAKREAARHAIMALDQKNKAEIKDPVIMFLWELNKAVMLEGLPIARSVCIQTTGWPKANFENLVRRKILQEHRLTHRTTRQQVVAYTLSDDLTFSNGELCRVLPREVPAVEEAIADAEANGRMRSGIILP